MRYWDRFSDPDKPNIRIRSTIVPRPLSAPSQFGQRPLFSEPGPDQPPPDQGFLGSEARMDGVTPVDESQGSQARTDLETEARTSTDVVVTVSTDNVSVPPTKAQIDTALGANRPAGFIGIIIDNGGVGTVFLCVRSLLDSWWTETLTKAP